MNQQEYVDWKLEENVKKREDLKEKHNEKRDEYLKAKEEFENSDNASLNAISFEGYFANSTLPHNSNQVLIF